MLSQQKIQLSTYEVAYWQEGGGIPVIFLHGFLGNSQMWRSLVENLAQISPGFSWVGVDLLGFGGSAKPDLKYQIWDQVQFVAELIKAKGWEQFYVVGYSYGGWAGAAIACEQIKGMKALVLIAPAGIRDDQFVGRYWHLRPLLWSSPLVDLGLAVVARLANIFNQAAQVRGIIQARQALQAQPVAKSFLRDRLRPEDAIDTLEAKIHQIDLPTLVIAGSEDQTIPLWHCQAYAQGIPAARLEVLVGADHDLVVSQEAEIASLIAEFLASVNRNHG
ncbi:MAG: alpha/beta hydrolase [Pseudanabaenaceae cyanobacterium bins.68]|nr:alpha/beta hydrolase [Pseudanabaenaceae cyanobacterium bins.68]